MAVRRPLTKAQIDKLYEIGVLSENRHKKIAKMFTQVAINCLFSGDSEVVLGKENKLIMLRYGATPLEACLNLQYTCCNCGCDILSHRGLAREICPLNL